MIVMLNIEKTIEKGHGHFWWKEWKSGGYAPAECNFPFMCYDYQGAVYLLLLDKQTTFNGGCIYWKVQKAPPEIIETIKK